MKEQELILVDNRWIGKHGIGRFAQEVLKRVPGAKSVDQNLAPSHPLDPLFLSYQIAKYKPKAFFSPGYNAPLYSGIPFIFTIHDLNHLEIKENSSVSKRLYYKIIMKSAIHRAHKVLTVSEFSKKSIADWAKISEEKIVNVGNGISEGFSPNGDNYEPGFSYFLYVGNTKPHKNISRMIEAYSHSKVSDKVKFILVCEPHDYLEELTKRFQLEDKIIIIGPVDEAKLASLYRGAMCIVFVSLYEGFGLPALEAMASGTPVIASNTSALPEVVGDAAMLVDPENISEISRAISLITRDAKQREKMRQLGITQSQKYSWEITAEKVNAILSELALPK